MTWLSAQRVADLIAETAEVKSLLAVAGKDLVEQVVETMSLRELARRTGLSPTYLCQVRKGNVTISPQAFVDVASQRQKGTP